ncbi:putative pentatricopeptide repeat-containing protein At3g01580 [Tasmannia lanceolata]|uniref:putative pentatricopeptide repeat-containing protein At3g01580 n=1 Tax=Tasmannia lanceolata TaxID=3420 RepID=UPI004064464B
MLSLTRLSERIKPNKATQKLTFKPTSTILANSQIIHYTTQQDSHLGFPIQTNQLPKSLQTSTRTQFQNHVFLLRSSTNLHEVRKMHGLLLVSGFINPNSSMELGSQLVYIYVRLDSLQEALLVFNQLPKRTVFAWNSILKGLINVGQFSETIEFYHLMLKEDLIPDNFTYPLVLKACSGLCALEQGKQIQELIKFNEIHHKMKPNIFVECAMIDMFAKCGSLNEARRIFDKMSQRDLVSWGAMVCGTVQDGDWYEALSLFRRMRLEGFSPDSDTIATVLPACSRLGALQHGMGLHSFAIRIGVDSDLYVSNALIDMYCKCGNTHEARWIFRGMEIKDVVSWSSLISGHSQNFEYNESLDLYLEMKGSNIRPNSVVIASVLPGFADLKLIKQGKEIHNYVIKHGFQYDVFVASALVDMYAKFGSLNKAEFIFEITYDRDIVMWNSMIAVYAFAGDFDSAFRILQRFHTSKFHPNSITIMSVLPLCTRLAALRHGKEIHGYTFRSGLSSVVSVENSIIDMYCKCGYLELGRKVFENMVDKDIVTYNTIIDALGMHGHEIQAFSIFNQMKKERIKPDKITFIALLSACSHGGLVDSGWFFYNSMIDGYGIVPEMEHYSCMVDLLGRSGHLEDAWEFIRKMPVEPGIDVLGSLLGACRVHKKIKLAEVVAELIFSKNLDDPGYYVLLSNIYASVGRWADVMKVRTMIKEKGLIKKPGNSWIQVGCSVHLFIARDRSHLEFDRIRKILKSLSLQMKDEGYIPDISFVLHDLAGNDEEFASVDRNRLYV